MAIDKTTDYLKEVPLDEYFEYLKKKWPCSEETLRTGIISKETQRMTIEAHKKLGLI